MIEQPPSRRNGQWKKPLSIWVMPTRVMVDPSGKVRVVLPLFS